MSDAELFIDRIDGGLYAAVVRKGRLFDLYSDTGAAQPRWGAIYLGKTVKIDTKLDAAILDLGGGALGILPAKHVRHLGADASETRTGISALLKTGQTLIVQVKSEGRSGSPVENGKLPRLTTKVYLPGNCLSYSPYSAQVSMSREIDDKKILSLAAALEGTGGWIVHARAMLEKEKDITQETSALQNEWKKVLLAATANGATPGLLRQGPSAERRALYDYGASFFEHIYAGGRETLEDMEKWSALHLPWLAGSKRLRLFRSAREKEDLFDQYDLYAALESLSSPRVELSGGGSLIIERTSALSVIDVNQGSGHKMEANQAAAEEIARQIRLRNMGGAILIDFIHSAHKSERQHLKEALETALAEDKAGAQMHGFTRLGLMEITRYRRDMTWAEKLEQKKQ